MRGLLRKQTALTVTDGDLYGDIFENKYILHTTPYAGYNSVNTSI